MFDILPGTVEARLASPSASKCMQLASGSHVLCRFIQEETFNSIKSLAKIPADFTRIWMV